MNPSLFLAASLFISGGVAKKEIASKPWVGARGITESVAEIMERARQNGDFEPRTSIEGVEAFEVDRANLRVDPASPAVPMWPAQAGRFSVQPPPGPPGGTNLPQAVGASFLTTTFNSWIPPDTTGSAGPTQVLVGSNGRIRVYDKTGNLGGLDATLSTFFDSVRNNFDATEPQVKYDRLTGRWFVTAATLFASPNRILIAASDGPTITSSSNFTFFQFQQDLVAPTGNTGQFAHSPKVGIDANAMVIGSNLFAGGSTFAGTSGWVVQKSSILGAGPIVVTAFRDLAVPGGNGPFAPLGVDNDDPAATVSYMVGVDNLVSGRLVLRRISDPGGTPTISGNLDVTVPVTTDPIPQFAPGSALPLRGGDDRLLACQIHRNRVTGLTSLWTAHTNEVDGSGVSTAGGGRNGSRWYQIDDLGTTPTLTQSGTLFDPAAGAPRGYWVPSVAMSGQGHMAMGTSYASPSVDFAGCAVAGRLRSDLPGTTQAPTLAVVSTTSYQINTGPTQLWGDYSAVVVDPTDDQTMWAFAEYCNDTNSWGVRAIQLRAPPPATPASASPNTLAPGSSNVDVTLTGTSSAGSEFYDTEPGFNRISAAFSGSGITIHSIAWDSPTQITLNLSASGAAPPGPRNLTVTNPDGQFTTGNAILTVGIGDCNDNDIADDLDIQNGTSQDSNANGLPDECEPIGSAYCFGDGTGGACPCGNSGAPGRGCANSIGQSGRLGALGTTTPDTVVLSATGTLNASFSVFLQGTASVGPFLYGDGLRCVGGTFKRLYSKNAAGGSVAAPQGAEPSITARSAALGTPIPGGATRYYLIAYRDPNPGFCPIPTGSTFNATNSISITW